MSTPAGWYDDGSGRQRWWDGQQWTENFAPETPATPAPQSPAAPQVPPVPQAPAASANPPYAAQGAYAAPTGGGYPAAAGNYSSAPTPPPASGPSIVGWIALGAAVLGFITVCIPPILGVGWFLLAAAFVLSIIAFFLRGKKWAPIVAICLSVVGAIVGAIVAFVILTAAFVTAVDEYSPATPLPSISADADDDSDADAGSTGDRPSTDEVAEGLRVIVGAQGATGYESETITCLAQELVDNPDVSDETLSAIAGGEGEFTDPTGAMEFATGLSEAIAVCAPELQ